MEQNPSLEADSQVKLFSWSNFMLYIEAEGSLPFSQESNTGLCLQSLESIPHPHIIFFMINYNIMLPSMPWSSKWFSPSDLLTKVLYAFLICPMHAT
jgi:hypothetical protein